MDNNAKSSFNIALTTSGSFWHNFRRGFLAKNVRAELSHLNEYTCSFEEARQKAKQMKADADAAYYARTGRRPKYDEKKIYWSAVVNARVWHSLADLEKVAEVIEDEMGYRLVYGCFHRDEGHPNDAGEWIENNHFHLEFISLDSSGISQHRKTFNPSMMSRIQTRIAAVLGMERGISKEITGRKHLPPRQYKQAIKIAEPLKQELKLTKDTLKTAKERIKQLEEQLKTANKQARADLQKDGAKREDYSALEQENKQLKNELAELKKAPANVNIDDEMAKIGKRIEELQYSRKILKEAKAGVLEFKNALGLLDKEKVTAFICQSVALTYAVREQLQNYIPILNDVERYKAEAAQAKNLRNNKIAQVFLGAASSKPDVDVDALQKENASLLKTFDVLYGQNQDLQNDLKATADAIEKKDAEIAKLRKNQEDVKTTNAFLLGQAEMLSDLVRSGQLYIEPGGRHLVESLDGIVKGDRPLTSFAGIKSGLLTHCPSLSSPKNDLEI